MLRDFRHYRIFEMPCTAIVDDDNKDRCRAWQACMSVYAAVLHLLPAGVQITCMHRLAHTQGAGRLGALQSCHCNCRCMALHSCLSQKANQTYSIDAVDLR